MREPYEFAIAQIGGHLIPLNDLPQRVRELDAERDIVVHCRWAGAARRRRSSSRRKGFKKVHNLAGGITAWSDKIDPLVPKY